MPDDEDEPDEPELELELLEPEVELPALELLPEVDDELDELPPDFEDPEPDAVFELPAELVVSLTALPVEAAVGAGLALAVAPALDPVLLAPDADWVPVRAFPAAALLKLEPLELPAFA